MDRRMLLRSGLAASLGVPLLAAIRHDELDAAANILAKATESKVVASAVLHVVQRSFSMTRWFGTARSAEAMFLLGSITKPVCVTALMSLFERGEFDLDDRLKKFIPEFTGEGRDGVTIRNLLTHVSGLPDQLPENNELRKNHAGLSEFVNRAVRTRLAFAPGSKYQYSSMGILLATHVAQLISKTGIQELVDRTVFQPLGMKHSSLGLGRFLLEDLMPCQTEHAAPEAGAGDPSARDWDWNSPYWRKLGAPWGGAHASAPDVARFLGEFLNLDGRAVKPATARLMTQNHNPAGLTPRGLGFNVGTGVGSAGCSDRTFGHTGSTGTLCWADPVTETICVVLTSLPGTAVNPHPRDLAATRVAAGAR